ncbi:MAG: tRNA pseudouridine(55) synthase TruB [Patulibacter sp.]
MTDVPLVPDGAVLIDKPAGASSHDIVHRIRRQLGGRKARRVGHTGTLDPFATGLLIVLIGRATRIQQHLMGLDKSYETLARLGALSTTGDTEGEITVTGALPADPPALPTGLIRQRPPAYSAIKIDGERAYARARRGEDVEVPEREVTVRRFEQLSRDGDRATYAIECSSGTYVRSLITDLGDGYCLELRRTAIGPFLVDQAQSPDDPPEAWRVIPLLDLLGVVMPIVPVDDEIARRATHGQRFALDAAPADGTFAIVHDDEPIAIAEREPDGRTHPVVGFRT